MKEIGIQEYLIKRIKELYTGTKSSIEIRDKIIRTITLDSSVRQGRPLSPTLFNVSMSELEGKIRKVQEGGVVIRKKKVYSISYADDVALVASSPQGLKGMMEEFGKYLKKIGLELNSEKSKIMVFRKERGKRSKQEFKWIGNVIEEVKEIFYLGYIMREDNEHTAHIKKLERKAKSIIRRIWSIGERTFKEDWEKK